MRALLLALLILVAAPAAAPAAVHLSKIGDFDGPVHVTAPPADPHRVFVVERPGRIQVVRDGQRLPAPFLDISGAVRSAGYEQGLLSMAFAPDYATSRLFYVYYTAPRTGDQRGSVLTVDEFSSDPANPDVAVPGSRRTVLTIDHPANPNHNGGQLQFGPDGLLWLAPGDGGSIVTDASGNSQNPASLLGKMLRIDPRRPGAQPVVHASGLRNPWRFSFDRATGDLTIADVGAGQREEVNLAPRDHAAGANYGWNCFEGTVTTGRCTPPPGDTTAPVLEQPHSAGWCAIVGGYVVRDPALPELAGRYVYGDNCQSELRSAALAQPRATDDRGTGLGFSGLTSFGEDSCGHVYVTSLNGPVSRIDGDSFTPCPEPAAADTTAPGVTLTAARIQRLLRRRALVAAVRCTEACGVTATATMRISGSRKVYRLRPATRMVAAGERARLTLKPSRRALRAFSSALRRGRRVSGRVSVTARDLAGNPATAARSVRARR